LAHRGRQWVKRAVNCSQHSIKQDKKEVFLERKNQYDI